MKKTTITGIVTLIIALSSGATYYIIDTGERTSCRNGFEYVDNGEFEGYYSCETATATRYEMCFEVYNSSNTENYWCKRGNLTKEIPQYTIKSESSGEWFDCVPDGCKAINN